MANLCAETRRSRETSSQLLMRKVKIRRFLMKQRMLEIVKYDIRPLMAPLAFLLYLRARFERLRGNLSSYSRQMSSLFRSGWAGSFWLVSREYKKIFDSEADNHKLREELCRDAIAGTTPLSNTEKFFRNPEELFEGIAIVLKKRTENEKGVLLIKYSYYFTLMFKLFDMEYISQNYALVLEPSWAGYADMSILVYTTLSEPVLVMTYEDRDKRFINDLNSNLRTVDIGPSWWVDPTVFQPDSRLEKKYDLIMVAAWDAFKRHHFFFRAIRKLKNEGIILKIALAGYSTSTTKESVWELAEFYGVEPQIDLYDKVAPKDVSHLFQISRINILWSRFEGNNRSIIEGMFCDVPAIMRQGHNYGQEYPYINARTGVYSSERGLPETIKTMLKDLNRFSPRKFVEKEMSCFKAIDLLRQRISEIHGVQFGESDIVLKINELDGMRYFHEQEQSSFDSDYKILASALIN